MQGPLGATWPDVVFDQKHPQVAKNPSGDEAAIKPHIFCAVQVFVRLFLIMVACNNTNTELTVLAVQGTNQNTTDRPRTELDATLSPSGLNAHDSMIQTRAVSVSPVMKCALTCWCGRSESPVNCEFPAFGAFLRIFMVMIPSVESRGSLGKPAGRPRRPRPERVKVVHVCK